MDGKYLGKILECDLEINDHGNLMLVTLLSFSAEGVIIKHVNLEKGDESIQFLKFLQKLLLDSKVNKFSELKGRPIEVLVEDNLIRDFRILTEVI